MTADRRRRILKHMSCVTFGRSSVYTRSPVSHTSKGGASDRAILLWIYLDAESGSLPRPIGVFRPGRSMTGGNDMNS
jgi:hypothetical protein